MNEVIPRQPELHTFVLSPGPSQRAPSRIQVASPVGKTVEFVVKPFSSSNTPRRDERFSAAYLGLDTLAIAAISFAGLRRFVLNQQPP